MIINKASITALQSGYRTIFLEAMHAAQVLWPKFAMTVPSMSAEELYAWMNAVPGMRKLIDEVQIRNLIPASWTVPNEEWEDTIGVKQADIERDRYGVYNPLVQAMGAAAQEHPDELLSDLLINGFSTVDYTGKNFFDANKVAYEDAKKFSNKVTKKLSAANYRIARANVKSRLNAAGRPMNLGRDLRLIVSPKNESLGHDILVADRLANGASNPDRNTATLEVWPRLATAEDAWFLVDAGHPLKPFVHQEEKKISVQFVSDEGDSYVVLNHKFIFQAYGRYNMGYLFPELAYGSDGSTDA